MSETDLMKRIQLRASEFGARLFRQNVGVGWTGNAHVIGRGDRITVKIDNARPLHAGLCKGSSDLIGWTPVKITADMVGKTVAVFTAIEVKTDGVVTTLEQQNFVNRVNDAGGLGYIARDVEATAEYLLRR